MKLGNEILLSKEISLLKGKKVGVLAHAASLDSSGRHIVNLLFDVEKDGGFKVTTIFGPEHGIKGIAQDLEAVQDGKYEKNGRNIPVYSLYGDTFQSLQPAPSMLKDVEVLVIDLQDIGSRYYTYANTMAFCMRVCAAMKIDVVICDRPNPINGVSIEGPIVEPEFRSFVGMYPLPVRHGKTIGELAKFFAKNDALNEKYVKIIPMSGWKREWHWDETGLKWTNPSPNMRSLTAALLYPGMCLLEGTNISEGRGTHTPFETIGAPWIDGEELARKLRSYKLEGIDFDPTIFTPTARKFEGERCEGLQFIITDRKKFKSFMTGLALIHAIALLYRKHFKWRREPYEFVDDLPAIDVLTGNGQFRKLVDKGKAFEEIGCLTN
ncbi:MAG: DUF1343 domain-containing protein [Deltaproteobacteria bacterium]|nr:DUF1343 domain-containing protein [Deltaproteobacteria bacterium]